MISAHFSILEFKQGRYLKLAILLCLAAIGAYGWYEPLTLYLKTLYPSLPTVYPKPYGGTWLGYTLGTIGALIILWLMLLGIRKRSYASRVGSVQGWTSAHVYLGASLIIIATLHCGFEFGWNIHTLAYVLMVLVIASGFFGVYAYLHYPQYATANLSGETLSTLLLKVSDSERKCEEIALDLPDQVNTLLADAFKRTLESSALGGSFRRQLAGADRTHPMRVARDQLLAMSSQFSGPQVLVHQRLVTELTRIVTLTDRVRRDLQLRALMQFWLYFHVPLSFSLLAALIAHIISVFYFW